MTSPLHALLQHSAAAQPAAPALLAPGRQTLSYAALLAHLETTVQALRAAGIQRNDRVAILLPNGPDMATAFLAVACAAAAAPLNPAYRANEFDFYLGDLDAKALIIQQDLDSPARDVARQRGIPLLELTPQAAAGDFTLSRGLGSRSDSAGVSKPAADNLGITEGGETPPLQPTSQPDPADIALVLHTSGTTSRPKIVPLTQANLAASADNIRRTLALTPADRCLNIMPLFHIHGLMAALLASLAAGASVVCTPGFQSADFFGWMDAFQPTWYTAVPTMHQSILTRAAAHQPVIARIPLRFVRSSSASLPPQVMAALEDAFACPVIEAYGMTEAAHQMASNPLTGPRKPSSVGLPAGPEIAIMDQESPELRAPGQPGEIVIRGTNVTPGYAANPAANAQAFTPLADFDRLNPTEPVEASPSAGSGGAWFRTGDQGYLDADGYLHLTGRIKEIINRGGEKISPREIDEVLLDHPAVAQAVAFAMPDAALGEEVAAAVVLREAGVTETDLRHFAAQKLADFKIPRKILILDDIPKGATGKIQRIGLAEKLGLIGDPPGAAHPPEGRVPPGNPLEELLAEFWQEILEVKQISVDQRFLKAGGDSISAMRLVNRLRGQLEVELTLVDFFDSPTIRAQAIILEAMLLEKLRPR